MKTVITGNIDGYNVILGFDETVIDPVATRQKVRQIMTENGYADEANEHAEKIKSKNDAFIASLDSKGRMTSKSMRIRPEIDELKKEHIAIMARFIEKEKELSITEAVYFDPKHGEHVLTDKEYGDLREKVRNTPKENKPCLDANMEFSHVKDYRDRRYFVKKNDQWEGFIISKLGHDLPYGGKWVDVLSRSELEEIKEQSELDRIKSMSLIEREKERDKKIQSYLRLSAIEKTEYDLQGVEDSLEKAKSNFEARKSEMIKRYE